MRLLKFRASAQSEYSVRLKNVNLFFARGGLLGGGTGDGWKFKPDGHHDERRRLCSTRGVAGDTRQRRDHQGSKPACATAVPERSGRLEGLTMANR